MGSRDFNIKLSSGGAGLATQTPEGHPPRRADDQQRGRQQEPRHGRRTRRRKLGLEVCMNLIEIPPHLVSFTLSEDQEGMYNV